MKVPADDGPVVGASLAPEPVVAAKPVVGWPVASELAVDPVATDARTGEASPVVLALAFVWSVGSATHPRPHPRAVTRICIRTPNGYLGLPRHAKSVHRRVASDG